MMMSQNSQGKLSDIIGAEFDPAAKLKMIMIT